MRQGLPAVHSAVFDASTPAALWPVVPLAQLPHARRIARWAVRGHEPRDMAMLKGEPPAEPATDENR